jgi:glycosyltransferase involved in cell wall biosynthesis
MYRTAGVALGRAMGVVFAISPKAMAQYARAGFRRETIRPYGYFVRPAIAEGPVGARIAGALRLVYVGALIERKGLDVLARAVGICRAAGLDVTADLYGSGDASRWTGEGVVHRGTIPVGQAPATMRRYDAVVLPSRYDGWGAVVNEALQQGVPVLASDNVGASALVRASGAGGVFGATEVEGLVALVRRAIAERELLEEWRGRAAAYRPHLDPAVAAGYVRDCLVAHYAGEAAPVCPWY